MAQRNLQGLHFVWYTCTK